MDKVARRPKITTKVINRLTELIEMPVYVFQGPDAKEIKDVALRGFSKKPESAILYDFSGGIFELSFPERLSDMELRSLESALAKFAFRLIRIEV
ncbi:MAG: hypothetical protein ACE5OY_00185 [Candidatus Bathyarchaeia archaeon]